MNMVNWQGVYPALLTPFNDNDSIDFKMFETNLTAQMEAGIDGIVLAGSLGEASTLSTEEKKHLLLFAKEAVNGKYQLLLISQNRLPGKL